MRGFSGLGLACCPLVPKIAGSNQTEVVRIFQSKKILITPSFGGELQPSVTCRRFEACKRFLNLRGSRNLCKIIGRISRPQFHLSLLGCLASLRTYRHLATKVRTSKIWEKQWQTTPKNLSRLQCARAISVTLLGSGSCQPGLNSIEKRAVIKFFSCKAWRWRKFTLFWEKHQLVFSLVGLRVYQHTCVSTGVMFFNNDAKIYFEFLNKFFQSQ